MLTKQFERAEELSARHTVQELDAMDSQLIRRGTWAAFLGLVSMILVFFGPGLARFVGIADLDRQAIMLPSGIGVLVYLFLNGRYNGRRDTIALAKKLRLRADAGAQR